MSWFDPSGFSSFAKTALSQAQKSIDRVLDIEQDETNSAASKSSGKSSVRLVIYLISLHILCILLLER